MPSYNFRDKDSGEEWTESMSIAAMETLLKDNPTWETFPGSSFHIGDPYHHAGHKPPEAFRDVLREIRRKHKSAFIKNTVNTW